MKHVAALVASLLVATGPVSAEVYKDYEPSKEVWNVAFVKVKANKVDDYLMGLKRTWVAACDEEKKAGVTLECSIFVSQTIQNRDFNMMLVTKQPSAAVNDPDAARYAKINAALEAKLAEDQRDKIVENYDTMRSFFGDQDFRRVNWK
jgi:hypothetical protein